MEQRVSESHRRHLSPPFQSVGGMEVEAVSSATLPGQLRLTSRTIFHFITQPWTDCNTTHLCLILITGLICLLFPSYLSAFLVTFHPGRRWLEENCWLVGVWEISRFVVWWSRHDADQLLASLLSKDWSLSQNIEIFLCSLWPASCGAGEWWCCTGGPCWARALCSPRRSWWAPRRTASPSQCDLPAGGRGRTPGGLGGRRRPVTEWCEEAKLRWNFL